MKQQVRVFISSTFQDMLTERRVLMSRVFPRLADLCRQRNTEFVGIDLRWGITEEQAKNEETVDICLSEIEKCRPYFVGILGHRYGWVPEGTECSVTETEITHGALCEKGLSSHALFCFRSERLSKELAGCAEKDERMENLKARIAVSGHPVTNYDTIDEFTDAVYEGLKSAIESDFPERTPLSAEEQEEAAQEDILETQAARVIGRDADFERLNTACTNRGLVLLTGARGVGKSAFLAAWCLQERQNRNIFFHMIGQSGTGSWQQPVKRALRWLKETFQLMPSVPDTAEGLRRAFPLFLKLAAESGKLIMLAFDGIDRLKIEDGFGLSWLPERLPENVTMLLSMDEGEVLSRLQMRQHSMLSLAPVSREDVLRVTTATLINYGKRLDNAQLDLLAGSDRTRNPQYLSVLLNEICHVGRFETLSKQIMDYLQCKDCTELLEKVLVRCEKDYSLPIGELLGLICQSREGLTESECRGLLSDAPMAQLSALFLSLEPFFAVQNGAMYLSDPHFIILAEKRYFPTADDRKSFLLQLCSWFSEDRPRRIRELPYLLEKCGKYDELWKLLNTVQDFCFLWRSNESECKRLWAACVRQRGENTPDFAIQNADPENLLCIASFLSGIGQNAQKYTDKVIAESKDAHLLSRAWGISGNQAATFGRFTEAEHAYQMQANFAKKAKDRYEMLRALGNLGLIAQRQGRLQEAEESYTRIITLAENLHHTGAMQIAHSRLGAMALTRGELDKAQIHFLRQKQLCAENGDRAGLMQAAALLGHLSMKRGDFPAAQKAYSEQLMLARELQDADGMQNAYGSLALPAMQGGNHILAEEYIQNKLEISKKSGIFVGWQNALGMLIALCLRDGRLAEAERYVTERINLCKEHKALPQTAEALVQQGEILLRQGRDEEAQEALLTAQAIAKQHGLHKLLAQIKKLTEN